MGLWSPVSLTVWGVSSFISILGALSVWNLALEKFEVFILDCVYGKYYYLELNGDFSIVSLTIFLTEKFFLYYDLFVFLLKKD